MSESSRWDNTSRRRTDLLRDFFARLSVPLIVSGAISMRTRSILVFFSKISPANCGFASPFYNFMTWPFITSMSDAALPAFKIRGSSVADHVHRKNFSIAQVSLTCSIPLFLYFLIPRLAACKTSPNFLALFAADFPLSINDQLVERSRRDRTIVIVFFPAVLRAFGRFQDPVRTFSFFRILRAVFEISVQNRHLPPARLRRRAVT